MSDATPRLALPFIASGQAQKELFHNEALLRIDALLQPAVQTVGDEVPPTSPSSGQCWITGATPTGDWSGQAAVLAAWTEGGWRFVSPQPGMMAWSIADGVYVRFDGAAWQAGDVAAHRLTIGGVQVVGMQQSSIAAPIGGGVVDVEARAAISTMLAMLKNHGLIAN